MADGTANISEEEMKFDKWLCSRLNQLGLDEEVFGSYVIGVMDAEDSSDDDRKDALVGILDGMTVCFNYAVCTRVLRLHKVYIEHTKSDRDFIFLRFFLHAI